MVEMQKFPPKKPDLNDALKPKKCTPVCEFFRCSQRALKIQNNKGRKVAMCYFVPGGDYCQGANCNYGFCAKHKLKPGNLCGLYVKPKKKRIEVNQSEENKDWVGNIQFKNKVLKRIKNKDKFNY
ncbi:MAG: hypothetical protein ACTSYQ_00130 [Candidatus Odinarchaeia archaeon]